MGILAALLALAIVLLIRRQRRHRRRRQWLAGMQRPTPPPDPFRDPSTPQMRNATNVQDNSDDRHRSLVSATHVQDPFTVGDGSHGMNHTGVGSGMHATEDWVPSTGPFSDDHAIVPNRPGLVIATDRDTIPSRLSLAQSSPSIYPPSLPEEDDEWQYDNRVQQQFVVQAPPRPPRSHLREIVSRPAEFYPMTPPPSSSSHSYSKPPSPLYDISKGMTSALDEAASDHSHPKGPQDIFARRTLLDVRPNKSRHEFDSQGYHRFALGVATQRRDNGHSTM